MTVCGQDSQTDRQLLLRVAEAISPGAAVEACSGQAAIDADDDLIEQLAGQPVGISTLRIWENNNCLVTTKRMARQQGFAMASERSRVSGWPVYIRSTGGSTVVHRPGILNVSLATISPHQICRPFDSYEELLKVVINGLSRLGVKADVGFVAQSYCNGRFNIHVDNRKIAGTASRIVRRGGKPIYLCHCSITVYGPIFRDVKLVNEFEAKLVRDRECNLDRHNSLDRLV